MALTKAQIIENVVNETGFTKRKAVDTVEKILEIIKHTLASGEDELVSHRLGDAHGKGEAPARPAPRHAEFAVNLSGALCLFLISTINERSKN